MSKLNFFVSKYNFAAQQCKAMTGVPVAFTLAQAALESRYGESKLSSQYNNFFGVKKSLSSEKSVLLDSLEQTTTGQTYNKKSDFVVYSSAIESFIDHGYFFLRNKRYANAFKFKDDDYAFAYQITIAGYATDLNYYSKLSRLITDIKKILNEPINPSQQFNNLFNTIGIGFPNTQKSLSNGSSNLIKNTSYVIIKNSKQQSLTDFIKEWDLNMTEDEILNFYDYDNKKSIYESYDKLYRSKNADIDKSSIPVGAKIAIPQVKMITSNLYSSNKSLIKNEDTSAFVYSEIKRILNNPKYKKSNIQNSDLFNSLYKRYDKVSVWIWCRSIDETNLINISYFLEQISTNTSKNGGNFSMKFQELTNANIKKLEDSLYQNDISLSYYYKEVTHFIEKFKKNESGANFFDDNKQLENDNDLYEKRKSDFFAEHIQANDIVFIRLEKLDIDKKTNSTSLFIDPNVLPDNYFDMIGLVDNVGVTTESNSNEKSVTISGRDLSKLIIEDGCYFFPIMYGVENVEQIIKNSTTGKAGNRLVIPKSNEGDDYQKRLQFGIQGIPQDIVFNFTMSKSISEWMSFVFSQMTNIDIAPDQLFSSYKGDRTFQIVRENVDNQSQNFSYSKVVANGIWQIVKLVMDKTISERKFADYGFSNFSGSILNACRKVCQEPFVDFYMDTYGDKYYFIVRKSPYNERAIRDNFTVNIFDSDVYNDDLTWETEAYTLFKLNPVASLISSTYQENLALLPAVLLPEFVEVFGNKILEIDTQYLDFDQTINEETTNTFNNILNQGREDLDWLIETHCYLPFTRTGRITIKQDRRIKRGMNIRYFPTGEIFYVEGVTQTRIFGQRTEGNTILQVRRGMVEKHLSKYFNIVNLLRNSKNNDIWSPNTWTVNKQVFEFFLKRKQFENVR